MICTARPTSARERISAYFDRMPEESLMVVDAVAKFDIAQGTACKALNELVKDGFLRREPVQTSETQLAYEYSAAA